VLKLLDEAQQAISDEKKAAVKASNNAELARLDTLSSELTSIANRIGNLSQEFDKAVSPLRNKLEQVEIWFDTVTQSFDERYVRHMKAVAIYISIVVVIVLNANFFRIYRSLSANEIQRDLIVASGPEVLERARKANEAEPTPSQSPATTPTPSPTPPQTSAPNASSTPKASPSPSPINAKAEIEKSRREINTLSSDYQAFGFSPLSGQQVWSWLQSLGVWTALERNNQGKLGNGWGFTLARNFEGVVVNKENKPIPVDCKERDKDGRQIFAEGYCRPDWRVQTGSEWWESRKSDVVTLLGWGVMVMLLSVGAPFWQDTLESLFGIKQLLRTKTGTKNVETPSGSGQPKE
jgi:cell division septation protein DedD